MIIHTLQIHRADLQIIGKFRQYLSARTAWCDGFVRISDDDYSRKIPLPGSHRSEHGISFRANRQTIRKVFHIAPGENPSTPRLQSGSHGKFRIFCISGCPNTDGTSDQIIFVHDEIEYL